MATSKEPGTAKKTTTRAPRAQSASTRASSRGKSGRSSGRNISVSEEERWRMIAVAAYHKAEQRGFAPGGAENDWFEAEQEVDVLLGRRGKDS
jgi:hypothetical protein